MKTLLKPRHFLLLVLVASASLAAALVANRAGAAKAQPGATVRAAGRGRPFLNLRDGHALMADDAGSAESAAAGGDVRPLALAAGDFDTDGAPDLLSGYAAAGQGFITLRRGNPDAFAPRDPAVFEAIQRGQLPDSFLPVARTFAVPEAPDFLVVGDFDRDGLKDVLSAARGGGLYLLSGDGAGNFAQAAQVKLAGGVTALAAGGFERGDGLSDVVVGINGPAGPEALIYASAAGGLRAKPSRYALPAPATSFALGEFDKDAYFDLAAAAGHEVAIIHATGDSARKAGGKFAAARTDLSLSSRVEHIALPFEARALTGGYFVFNRDQRKTLALLAADGAIHLLQPGDLDRRPYTPAELAAQSTGDQEVLRVTQNWDARPLPSLWQPGAEAGWELGAQIGMSAPPTDGVTPQAPLAASFVSYQQTADLLVVNSGRAQVNILRHLDEQADAAKMGRAFAAAAQFSVALDVTSQPVALLEMPRKVNGERDLVLLQTGSLAPSVVPAAPLATINVDRTDDVAAASACTAAGNDCSLRGAVSFANANASTVINVPANTYNITLSGAEDVNATGDLDLLPGANGVSFVGAGAATTIIQVNQASAPNERIFQVTPGTVPTVGWTGSWSGLTMQNGGSTTNILSGGAILMGGTDNVYNLSACTFNNNDAAGNIAGNGGAISQSAKQNGGHGQATFTNCTFTGNVTAQGVGGAIRTLGGTTTPGTETTNITGGLFDNNQATLNEGGAIFFTSQAGTYTISKVNFTNNKALDPNADTGGGGIQKSNGTLNLSFSRFRGNVVSAMGRGEGVKLGGNGDLNAVNNWWGCNTDPFEINGGTPVVAAAGCDSAFKVSTVTGNLITLPQLVLKHTANPAPIVTGQTTTLTASVNTNSANQDVSANVDVLLGLPLAFSNPVRGALSGAGTIIQTSGAGKGTATATFRASAAGAGAADATVESAVATANFTINKADTTSTITSDTPDPTVTGEPFTVNFSLAVNAPGSNNPTVPTGNVQVSDGVNSCTGTISAAGTGSCTIALFNAGNRSLTATYQGDANFNVSPASSPATAHLVNKADTTTTISTDNPDPSVTGQSITVVYGVSVNAPGAGTPTGNVVVMDGANTFCTGTVAAGQCTAAFTTVGNKTLTATYQGDANYNASPASSPATAHTVNKADTTAAILTDTPDPTIRGQQFTVTYSVAVTAPGAGTPTGNVQVSDGVDSCTGTVAAGQCNITLFTVGSRTLTATYQGDANFNASPASAGASHTVNKINTTTAVMSSKNPADVGDLITFTATITPTSGTDVPGGTVQFRDGPSGTGTAIGAPATVVNGVATVQTNALTAGTHTITADYSGDTNLNASSGTLAGGQVIIPATPTAAGDVLITEFRFRGSVTPSGAQDEFIELYNNTNAQLVVPSSGWTLRSSNTSGTAALVFAVPPGTTIPARAHFLVVNSTPAVGFTSSTLTNYPAGASTVGAGDGQFSGLDIQDGGGIALFNSGTLFDATTRLDAVGFTSAPDTLYQQGAGLTPAGGITADGVYSFVRKLTTGLPQNTSDNAADFDFIAADGGTYSGRAAVRGGPGPERLSSPIQRNATVKSGLIDPAAASTAAPNRVRDTTSGGAGTPTAFGTLDIRRKFTNTTGAPVTRLRFRVVDITTTNSPNGPLADMRVLSSTNATVTITGGSMVSVLGTTLETPPVQAQGGGLNSSVTVAIPGGTLANGASVNVRFVLGVAQGGSYRFFINVEALP